MRNSQKKEKKKNLQGSSGQGQAAVVEKGVSERGRVRASGWKRIGSGGQQETEDGREGRRESHRKRTVPTSGL